MKDMDKLRKFKAAEKKHNAAMMAKLRRVKSSTPATSPTKIEKLVTQSNIYRDKMMQAMSRGYYSEGIKYAGLVELYAYKIGAAMHEEMMKDSDNR